ncbi:MAG TPA: hypothetical protein VGF43_24495, partial [Dongiaceae bacterium]
MTALTSDLTRRSHLDPGLAVWLPVMLFMALCLMLRDRAPWLALYPSDWVLPIAPAIDSLSTAVTEFVKPMFRGIAWLMDWPMRGVQAVLQWIPWPIMMVLVGVTALRAGGRSLAWFALAALLYLLVAGYWPQSMNTL